jgi:tetratricopeptide (TPR) repeat protein
VERRRGELGLRLQIGPSLNAVHGYASDAVRANYDRALGLCDDHTGAAQRYAVLYALYHSHSNRAERAETLRVAKALLEQAEHLGPAERWLAQSLFGRTALFEGAFAEARARLEPLRATWPHTPGSDAPLFGPAPLVALDGHLAQALWYLGFPEQAAAVCRDALALGQQSDSAFTLAAAIFHSAWQSYLRSEPAETARIADQLAAVALDQGFAYWDDVAKALSGWALAQRGDAAGAVARIEAALAANRASGAHLVTAHMLSFLAEAQGRLGNVEAGLAAAEEGLKLSQHTLSVIQGPELWRIKGELLAGSFHPSARARASTRARRGAVEAAEQCIRKSIELARAFGSPSLELRAALSLADSLLARGARDEARALVGPVYDRFTEGLGCEDQKRAAALMASG